MAEGNYTAMGAATGEFLGTIIGQLMAQGRYAEVARLREEARKRFGSIGLPALEAIAEEELGPSALEGVQMDAGYKAAQDEALQRLMGLARSGGMDAQAEAQLQAASAEGQSTAKGLQDAALSSLARRGALSGGAKSAAMGRASQAGANRSYLGSIRAASDASQRGLAALTAGGSMARGMGQDDIALKGKKAGSADRIAEFNLRNRADTRKFNRGLQNQRFRNELSLAGAQNQRSDIEAGDQLSEADRENRIARGFGKGAGGLIGSAVDWGSDYMQGKGW